jgi:hypothetical protein
MIRTVTRIVPPGVEGFRPLSGRFLLIAKTWKVRESVRAYECTAVTGKQPRKDLKYALTGQGGAEWFYNSKRDQLLKEWVLNRALALLVASHKGKEVPDPPQTTETYNNVCTL